jgi:hypothetical protein
MGVSLKTDKRRGHCPVFSFGQRVRRAEGLPGMTTEAYLVMKDEARRPPYYPLSTWSPPVTLRFLF